MKVFNLLISNGSWTSSQLFLKKESAIAFVENLELGQREIEGDSMKCLFHYEKNDAVTPPFHAYGDRIYCSYAWTEFDGGSGCTWRAIYEQEVSE